MVDVAGWSSQRLHSLPLNLEFVMGLASRNFCFSTSHLDGIANRSRFLSWCGFSLIPRVGLIAMPPTSGRQAPAAAMVSFSAWSLFAPKPGAAAVIYSIGRKPYSRAIYEHTTAAKQSSTCWVALPPRTIPAYPSLHYYAPGSCSNGNYQHRMQFHPLTLQHLSARPGARSRSPISTGLKRHISSVSCLSTQ